MITAIDKTLIIVIYTNKLVIVINLNLSGINKSRKAFWLDIMRYFMKIRVMYFLFYSVDDEGSSMK
jgi:hypothetical protein